MADWVHATSALHEPSPDMSDAPQDHGISLISDDNKVNLHATLLHSVKIWLHSCY